ncbi:hypothetical protein E2C01_041218 [Portunus trituberculatus]|uniref:Uncharacterized protein n=1 Tax=Portunus trituberculatus TaxID=210409 RepID=A0A5B7FIN3_PORTR|nr:hypothetical protein [Portunus trituberculatus]
MVCSSWDVRGRADCCATVLSAPKEMVAERRTLPGVSGMDRKKCKQIMFGGHSGGLNPANTSATTTTTNPSSYSAPPMGFRMPPPGPGMPPRLPPPGFMSQGGTPGMPPPAFNVPPPGFLNSFSQAGAGKTSTGYLPIFYLFNLYFYLLLRICFISVFLILPFCC